MAEIFDYDDYRDMIKDYYLEHKKHNSLYSFSTLGKTLGLDSSHAYYIVQKKRNLPVHAVPAFENYPIKVINMYDLQKENHLKFAEFMIKSGFRIIITYYMKNVSGGAYLIYVSNIGSACRFAETDFSDLTYFSRILELSGKLSGCDCSKK